MRQSTAYAISTTGRDEVCFRCGHGASLHSDDGPVGCVGCFERTDRHDCPSFAEEPLTTSGTWRTGSFRPTLLTDRR